MNRCFRSVLIILGIFLATVCAAQKITPAGTPRGHDLKRAPQIAELYGRYQVEQCELDENGLPAFLSGDLTPAARSTEPTALAYAFFGENLALYRMVDPQTELRMAKSTEDEAGTQHLTFRQYYQNVPVLLSELKVHVSAERRITAVNGSYYPEIVLNPNPAVSAVAAENRALSELGVTRGECTFGTTDLFVYPYEGQSHLAWRVDVVTGQPAAWWLLIDAHSGEIIHRYPRLYDGQPQTGSDFIAPTEARITPAESLRQLEAAPLTTRDEERFVLENEIWVRYRGEFRFHRAETITDFNAEMARREARGGDLARRTTCDVSLDLRNPAHWDAVSALGYAPQPLATAGYYHTLMTKADTRLLVRQGVPLERFPNLPETGETPAVMDDGKPDRPLGGSLDETLLTQTFEGTFPPSSWTVGDSNVTNGLDYWDDVSCRAHSGSWSAWCADIGASTSCSHYDDNSKSYMRTPVVNLAGRTNCQLSFWWWNNSEPDFDYFREYYSADGVHWTLGGEWTGIDTSWQNFTAGLYGFSNYYQLFLFSSDGSFHGYEGAYVDDITITADWAACGETGTGVGVMGAGQNHIDTDYAGGMFRLNDLTRRGASTCWHTHDGAMSASASISTYIYTMNFPTTPGALATDADNYWTYAPAVDAHIYAGLFYDYLLSQLGRNGHAGSGLNMWSTVDVSTLNNNAAYWGGRVGYGTVGAGHRSMAGAPDIVAHEWAHGITEFESNLLYEKESGALNESFADMIGTAFGFATGLDADWVHGENWNTNGAGNRSMANPPLFNQPDYYGGTYWVDQVDCEPASANDYCGVHTNSGVGNKFFYLLSAGGTFHGIPVTGIGIANAMTVVYRANRDYWSSTSTYSTARAGCMAAAMAVNPLFVNSVKDAWAAVGVGDPTEHSLYCTGFTSLTNGVGYSGTTVGGARNVMDYGCSNWNESGPEKVHRITFTGPMTLTATLSNLGDNDLDLFLLSTCDDASCVAYGDDSISCAIPAAGTYYIVVDGFEGAQGSYTLTASALGSITLLTPNGGETYYAGEGRAITWNSSLSENMKIEIDRNYPSTWSTLAPSVSNTGAFNWPVSGPVTANARIRISGVTHTSVRDTSNASFTIAARSLTLTAPNGGESWVLGSPGVITWESLGLVDENVKIELKRTYPGGIWETLVRSTANRGSWTWAPTGATSSTARIRITGTIHTTVKDTSDANFILTTGNTPSITVTAPNGGESWLMGGAQIITWSSTSLAENVKIELNRNYSVGEWETITGSTANDGVYPWTVTGAATPSARVRISGVTTAAATDMSNANFTISAAGGSGGLIVVTSPNGGESWVVGSAHTINWSAPLLTGNVKIQINRSYPAGSWITLTSNTANDGVHPWTVTPGTSSTIRVRVMGVTITTAGDTSDANFTITPSRAQMPGQISGMADVDGPVPTEAYLAQNYPNPFNPSTTFEFGVPDAAHIRVRVFDITGRDVVTLVDDDVTAGRHQVRWNCADCPAGVYLVVLSGDGFSVVQKATFLK